MVTWEVCVSKRIQTEKFLSIYQTKTAVIQYWPKLYIVRKALFYQVHWFNGSRVVELAQTHGKPLIIVIEIKYLDVLESQQLIFLVITDIVLYAVYKIVKWQESNACAKYMNVDDFNLLIISLSETCNAETYNYNKAFAYNNVS